MEEANVRMKISRTQICTQVQLLCWLQVNAAGGGNTRNQTTQIFQVGSPSPPPLSGTYTFVH